MKAQRLASVAVLSLLLNGGLRAQHADLASHIQRERITGGLVASVNAGIINEAALLSADGKFIVHGVYTDQERLDKALVHIAAGNMQGRVTASTFDGANLPFVDRVVNVLIVDEDAKIAQGELMRVLAPRGFLLRKQQGKWSVTRKPVPATIDDWTHNLYNAGNTGVSRDLEAGALRHLQWTGNPRFSRSHDGNSSFLAMVTAGGRLFYMMDEGSTAFLSLPSKWNLIARDGFNGKVLWRRPIEKPLLMQVGNIKSGFANLGHRLVAHDDVVYATLGFNAPVSALDSRTGRELWTNAKTANTEELILFDGVLFCVINLSAASHVSHPFQNMESVKRRLAATIPRKLVALDVSTGTVLWEKKPPKILPLSLTAGTRGVFIHDGSAIVCLAPKTGEEHWRSGPMEFYSKLQQYSGVNMVLKNGVLLFACGSAYPHKGRDYKSDWQNTITALDAQTGKVLWRAPHRQDGIFVTPDLLVADGLVWHAPIDSGHDSGHYLGLDLRTGNVVRDMRPEKRRQMPHHRCYRNRGTDRFIFTGWTGINTFDVKSGKWDHNYWIRGACRYGVMPANGLLYNTPSVCTCSINAKIKGLNALADDSPTRRIPEVIPEKGRLVKGPAYGRAAGDQASVIRRGEWTTYRGAADRHGVAASPLADSYAPGWKVQLGGKLTQPVIGDGRLLVAAYDQHAVYALDFETGKRLWCFQAGSVVDSPPTLWQGTAIFGCRDGWIYCLDTTSGALAWKYRAAPLDRRIVAGENLESVWPVQGSVLVLPDPQTGRGKVYAIAGRSIFLDGGLRSLVLDATTGIRLAESVMNHVDPATGKDVQQGHEWPDLPAGLPDVLSFSKGSIYMGIQPLSLDGKRRQVYYPNRGRYNTYRGKGKADPVKRPPKEELHLFSTIGFLDDSEMHRSVWMVGKDSFGGCWGFPIPTFVFPAGQILSVKGDRVYGYGREFYNEGNQPFMHLFACDTYPDVISYAEHFKNRKKKDRRGGQAIQSGKATVPVRRWSKTIDTYVRALLVGPSREAGKPDLLFVAGHPEVIDEHDAIDLIRRQQKQFKLGRIYLKERAVSGEFGAKLMVVSTVDGSVVSETKLDAPPVFDGMAAAGGKLFIADIKGNVVCLQPSETKKFVDFNLPVLDESEQATARGDNPPRQTATEAFDGDIKTKWLDFSPQRSWIQYDYRNKPKAITKYAITSAEDAPQRDPRDWQLLASNNGKNWITLDARTGEMWSRRNEKRSFSLNNKTAFRFYRLNITAARNAKRANSIQIAEIELLE